MYTPLDNIIRSAIANKGHSTLHLYVPYLHWGSKGVENLQTEGVYPNIRVTKENVDENNCIPMPEDMVMWNRLGIVINGVPTVFINNDSLSLWPKDHNKTSRNGNSPSMVAYTHDTLAVLYSTNVYIATDKGVVLTSTRKTLNFRANWEAKKFQIQGNVGTQEVYLEYVARAFDPTSATMVNEVSQEYVENFIYFREARFKFGAAHRETKAAEAEWLESQDDMAANMSDLTADGLLSALAGGTRLTIDQ